MNKGKKVKMQVKVQEEKPAENNDEEISEDMKEEADAKEKDIRTVTITLEHYENIVPLYPTADIQTKCKYLDKTLGETKLIPITDDPNLTINESFTFKLNVNSKKDTDHLISAPALLTVSQFVGMNDPSFYEQLQTNDNLGRVGSTKSFDSIVSLYEAFTGDTVDRDIVDSVVKKTVVKAKKPEKKKERKGSSSIKASKLSKGSKNPAKKIKQKKSEVGSLDSLKADIKPSMYGMCVIDFLPLFYGKSSYTETLMINPMEILNDEHMTTHKICPKITVSVSIDKEICFFNPVILNVTLESIYNIPSIMKPEMDYKICAMLPMENSPSEPMLFSNSTYQMKTQKNVMKCWPGIKKIGVDTNTTKYKLSEDTIKNTTKIDNIENCIEDSNPSISFNILKRNLLLTDGISAFQQQVKKYKKVLLEMFVCPKEKSKLMSKPSEIEIEISTSKLADISKKKSANCLHLMTMVDISTLLYPGVSKVRVASPLTTFNFYEALKDVGVTDSYFFPKPVEPEISEDVAEVEAVKSEKKSDKSKKKEKSTMKSSKSSKKGPGKAQSKVGLVQLLPPQPESAPEPEPSVPVFNENGKQSFLVVEIELSQPILEKQSIEDLNNDLQELLREKMDNSSKIVLTHRLTKDHYREVLNQITKDIYDKYKSYVLMREISTVAEKDFMKYLESVGAYQTYLTSIKESISLLTATKFRIDEIDKKSSLSYQNFIGDVFVYLVSEMNDTLNRLICSGLEPVVTPAAKPSDVLYFYAKEAVALGNTELADRYFLERISYDGSQSPDSWFDYAVFNLQTKKFDRAYECVLEALKKNPVHKYSLLLLGIMLANKGQKDEAETCFLNLLVHQPRWVEGWVTLYIFYTTIEKYEGMDMVMDMVKKYIDDERLTKDYFSETEDLLWTSSICPKTMFFRAAILLLKMRVYDWVEMALVQEVQENFGIIHYLLTAVCLYQELYEQALEHIQHTKAYCGPNHAVSSLSGHCLFALNRHTEAQEDYNHVLQSPDRPNDIHMVYVNCAQILDNSGDHQEARKLILLACKYTPTHYTWYRAGQLYLQENDLLSAEECFSEANFKDNRCAKYWGYLTIINLKLKRTNEAELCYSQAIKNDLDQEMQEEIKQEFKKVCSEGI